MQAIGRKHTLYKNSTNSTSTRRNKWWTQPVRRGPDIWHRLRVGYEIMVFMIGYSFSQNKDRGVAPVNDDVWRQKKAMVSTDDTGALRPDKRPRWKRRQTNGSSDGPGDPVCFEAPSKMDSGCHSRHCKPRCEIQRSRTQ